MEESYVSFETVKMLKEAGFHIPCIKVYNKGSRKLASCSYAADSNQHRRYFSSPTQALAARWLRETHGIHVYALQTNLPATKPQTTVWEWGYVINKVDYPNDDDVCDMGYISYEEAFEAGLQEAIKRIKNVGRTE